MKEVRTKKNRGSEWDYLKHKAEVDDKMGQEMCCGEK